MQQAKQGKLGEDAAGSDGSTERVVPSLPGAYQAFYAGMVRALRDGAPVPVDPSDAVAGLEIIEAAQRSSAERKVIALP